jgi:hypothetical protein
MASLLYKTSRWCTNFKYSFCSAAFLSVSDFDRSYIEERDGERNEEKDIVYEWVGHV